MGKVVKIDNVQPGMVLDKDVANLQGAVLLRKGNEVTARHISVFKTWGVVQVFIKETISAADLGGKTPQEVAEATIANEQKKLDDKFSDFSDDELMQTIKAAALKLKMSQVKRKYNV